MATRPSARAVPGLGAGRLARPLAGRGGDRLVPHGDALRDPAALACPDTGIVNCTLVTTSSWSVVLGVPLAVLGLVWAVVMAGLTMPWAWRRRARWVDGARLVVSGAGAAMVLYLVYVELFRIGAICLWCTAMHVTAVCLFGVVLAGRAASSKPLPARS